MRLKEQYLPVCVASRLQPPIFCANFVFAKKILALRSFLSRKKERGSGVGGRAADFDVGSGSALGRDFCAVQGTWASYGFAPLPRAVFYQRGEIRRCLSLGGVRSAVDLCFLCAFCLFILLSYKKFV